MSLKIVRNDITKMETEAIVNTAGSTPVVGSGCDSAVYKAAGFEKLHKVREEIGNVAEGEVFITPGFDLKCKYIIHAVSPLYIDGNSGEVDKLRSCYQKSLILAKENNIRSIAFPLIATGSFAFPRAYGLRIAMDEINSFLLNEDMEVYLVVFDPESTRLAEKLHPMIEAFIDHEYVTEKRKEEYKSISFDSLISEAPRCEAIRPDDSYLAGMGSAPKASFLSAFGSIRSSKKREAKASESAAFGNAMMADKKAEAYEECAACEDDFSDLFIDEDKLNDRVKHLKDPFGVYLLYLSERKGISLTVLESTAWVSKHVVHNVKKNPEVYKPDKRTAFKFCVGLNLSLDDTKDLLSRAGYAISESILEDRIWEFYIENEHFDIFDISDSLEKYGLNPIVDF